MNERAERMMEMLQDEWECVVLLGSRYTADGGTEQLRYVVGNAFANEKMLENMLDDMRFNMSAGIFMEEDDGEEEEAKG